MSGVSWIFPLLGVLFVVVMMMFCARMMRGMMGGGGLCGHGGRHVSATDNVRHEPHDVQNAGN